MFFYLSGFLATFFIRTHSIKINGIFRKGVYTFYERMYNDFELTKIRW